MKSQYKSRCVVSWWGFDPGDSIPAHTPIRSAQEAPGGRLEASVPLSDAKSYGICSGFIHLPLYPGAVSGHDMRRILI